MNNIIRELLKKELISLLKSEEIKALIAEIMTEEYFKFLEEKTIESAKQLAEIQAVNKIFENNFVANA